MISDNTFRLPAEWEPQSGVMLTWPHAGTDWAPMLDEIVQTYQEMAREISRHERLLIVVPAAAQSSLQSLLADTGCRVCTMDTDDTWARDHGFITLVQESAESRVHSAEFIVHGRLLDFCFNGWGEKFAAGQDNAINRRLYDMGAVRGEYVSHLDFVLEGGSIESDGRGTIFTTSQCLLAPHRNQPLTREGIEQRLKEYLSAERVLWIDHGSLTGDDTDGHIDTLVRIAPDDTLLYVGCDDPADEQYEELGLMEEQLRTFRTLDGRPYRLLRLPMPRPIYDTPSPDSEEGCDTWTANSEQGERLPATYANFLVVNGAVLVPTYAQPDLDAEAMRIIGQAFPDRDIVGIDCRSVIRQHGSLHCCTMQFPVDILHC